jgi:urocanate hydratase
LDDALRRMAHYARERRAVSVGLLGNAAEVCPNWFGARNRAASGPTS